MRNRMSITGVAETVFQLLTWPLFLVPPSEMPTNAETAGDRLAGRLARGEALRFVVATDGSPFAQDATRFAGHLARILDTRVTLLAVIPDEGHLSRGRAILDEGRRLLGDLEHPAETQLLIGYADEEIITYVDQHPTDLIVIGAFGDRGATRFLIGSTAYRIVKHAPASVLMVKNQPQSLQKLLICTAGRDDVVVEVGGRLAQAAAAQAILLHVLPPSVAMYLTLEQDVRLPLSELLEEDAVRAQHLQEQVERLRTITTRGDVILRRGYLPDTIFEEAENHKVDLIVVGSQAHEGRSWFLLGSVTDRVVKYAHRSVLVVRTRPV
jgi:nucleotide-binding universal stress UspA family protein